jgi:hypothetical protein
MNNKPVYEAAVQEKSSIIMLLEVVQYTTRTGTVAYLLPGASLKTLES